MVDPESGETTNVLYVYRFVLLHLLALPLLLRYDTVFVSTTYRHTRRARRVQRLLKFVNEKFGINIQNSNFSFLNVRIVPNGEDVDGFQPMDLKAKRLTTEILQETEADRIRDDLAVRVGQQGANSFFVKGTAYHENFSQYVLDLLKLEAMYDHVNHVPRPHFPIDDIPIEACHAVSLGERRARRYVTLTKVITASNVLFGLLRRSLFNPGIEVPARRSFPIANEIGHPDYVEGKPGQADYLVDGEKITEGDILFYRSCRPIIGGLDAESLDEFAATHENFVDLRDASPSLSRILNLTLSFWRADERTLSDIGLLTKALSRRVEFGTLYREFDIQYDTTPTFSNDKRAARFDSGLVTGLANDYGTENVNYQTRSFYIYSFEHEFDCLDRLYVWSEEWVTAQESAAFENVREITPVGNTYQSNSDSQTADDRLVAVFTTDLDHDGRHNLSYNLEFLEVVFELSERNPEYEFVLKPKFANQTETLLAESPQLPPNVRIKEGLYNTGPLIEESYITIAIGITSPGIEAFMNGTRTIYYSDIGELNGPLADAEFVCETTSCVLKLFEQYKTGYRVDQTVRERFDPFGDEKARDRIVSNLVCS